MGELIILFVCLDMANHATVGALPGSASLLDGRRRRVGVAVVGMLLHGRLLLLTSVAPLFVTVESGLLTLKSEKEGNR